MRPVPGFRDLVQAAQDGDTAAMDRILEMLRPELERLASGYADPRRAAESTQDVVQEAWVRAWQSLVQFRGAGKDEDAQAMFCAWIGQIVHRVGLNAQRSWRAPTRKPTGANVLSFSGSKGESATEPPDAGPSPSAVVRADEEAILVRRALERLDDELDRRIVLERFFEGRSLREVARRVDLPYHKVRQRFDDAMVVLERELGASLGPPPPE